MNRPIVYRFDKEFIALFMIYSPRKYILSEVVCMLKLTQVHLQRGTKTLLNGADLYVRPNEKVGIIGKNGAGKSSFFALLLKQLEYDGGAIEFNKSMKIAHLAQEIEATEKIALEFVIDGDAEFRDLEQLIDAAEAKHDGLLLSNLHEKMLHIDGYNTSNRAAALLYGLGFSNDQISLPVKAFSGGWRMRFNLAKTLMSRAEFYLLDEPTNHLDLEAIIWLEKWLQSLKATLLIISHDRDFLDNVVDHIAHIENQKIQYYAGNYSSFENQRSEQLILQQAIYEKQQRQRSHMQKFVDRFRYKASKAKQAQSRLKALERMSLVSAAHTDSEFSFGFKEIDKLPIPMINLENIRLGYDHKIILDKINLTINPGDRYGIIGPNGAGKSTFIKLLASEIKPLVGEIFYHNDLSIGYFTQHQMEYLDITASPLLHLQRIDRKVTEQIGRNFLGQFNFHGDMAINPITYFSGGERARLALALLIWQKPNLLLLDEPTNHFDLDMRHALTMALQDFTGAIVLISHDRHLIRTTTDELLLVYQGQLKKFEFSIDEYPACLDKINVTSNKPVETKSTNKKLARQQAAQAREAAKDSKTSLKQLEKKMSACQTELATLAETLLDASLYEAANKAKLSALLQQQGELQKQLLQFEQEWLQLAE